MNETNTNMEETGFSPSADVKTMEETAQSDDTANAAVPAASTDDTTPPEGATFSATVAPFIVPVRGEGSTEEGPGTKAEDTTQENITPEASEAAREDGFADGKDDQGEVSSGGQDATDDMRSEEDAGDATDEVINPSVSLDKAATAGSLLSNEHKAQVVLKALKNIEQSVHNLIVLLEADAGAQAGEAAKEVLRDVAKVLPKAENVPQMGGADGGRIIEGVFNGHNMVGSDGKIYSVPPNYASKSKLVEGDLLKLTITPKGSFIYKQIGPIERSRVIGSLGYDHTNGEWYAATDNRRWSVIKASVTYFKGEPGDEIVLLIPKNEPSKWAAVENIIKKDPLV